LCFLSRKLCPILCATSRVHSTPGSIRLQSIAPVVSRAGSLTHSVTPALLLGLAKQLYERVPESAYLLTVGGESFEHPERLSHSVRRAMPAVLTQIKALLSGVSLPLAEFQSPSA
jgi:Ni,Fe-hydrogenase maturation factor